MNSYWNLLVVSSRLENKRAMLNILSDHPVNVFTAASIEQAEEVLSRHRVRLIFSEETVSDGTYQDLLSLVPDPSQVVVLLSTGEWAECLAAMKLGVREIIRFPLQPTDVELALIHAARDQASETEHLFAA